MKKFKTLFLISILFLIASCSYYFPKKERKVFQPELIETGFVLEKSTIKYDVGARMGKIKWYNVVVLDSCKNRTTYHTNEDCFNSLNPNDAVNVYTIEKLTKKKGIYSIKKYVKEYE